MESSIGKNLKITLFGGSHEPEIGVRINGLPQDFPIDEAALCDFLARRTPGKALTSARSEADVPVLSSAETAADGFEIRIKNTDIKASDYEKYKCTEEKSNEVITSYSFFTFLFKTINKV